MVASTKKRHVVVMDVKKNLVQLIAESGLWLGRAQLLAKKGNIWAHAASAGTGTDPLVPPWYLRKALESSQKSRENVVKI